MPFYGDFSIQADQARESLENIRTQCNDTTGERKRFWNRRLDLISSQARILATQVSREMKPDVMAIISEAAKLRK